MAFMQRACVSYSQLCADIKTLHLQHTFSSIFLSGLIQSLAPHAKSKNADFCVVFYFIFLEPLTNQSFLNEFFLAFWLRLIFFPYSADQGLREM